MSQMRKHEHTVKNISGIYMVWENKHTLASIPLCFGVQYIQRTAKRHSEYIRDASFLMFGQRQNFLAESCRKAGHTRKDNKV